MLNGVDWTHVLPSATAAFLASLVEFVEALTVVLAVGSVRGWRDALAGAAVALAVLLGLTAVLGPALTRIPTALPGARRWGRRLTKWLKTILTELWSLFIDDSGLA